MCSFEVLPSACVGVALAERRSGQRGGVRRSAFRCGEQREAVLLGTTNVKCACSIGTLTVCVEVAGVESVSVAGGLEL